MKDLYFVEFTLLLNRRLGRESRSASESCTEKLVLTHGVTLSNLEAKFRDPQLPLECVGVETSWIKFWPHISYEDEETESGSSQIYKSGCEGHEGKEISWFEQNPPWHLNCDTIVSWDVETDGRSRIYYRNLRSHQGTWHPYVCWIAKESYCKGSSLTGSHSMGVAGIRCRAYQEPFKGDSKDFVGYGDFRDVSVVLLRF